MAKIKSFAERIADALVEDDVLLSASQIEELLERQKKEGARLVKLLVDKDKQYVSDQDLAVCMGRVLNVSPISLARVSILPDIVELGSARYRAQLQDRSRQPPRARCIWRWPTR